MLSRWRFPPRGVTYGALLERAPGRSARAPVRVSVRARLRLRGRRGAGGGAAGAGAAAGPVRLWCRGTDSGQLAATETVTSSSAVMLISVPATGDGISVSTLSVETRRGARPRDRVADLLQPASDRASVRTRRVRASAPAESLQTHSVHLRPRRWRLRFGWGSGLRLRLWFWFWFWCCLRGWRFGGLLGAALGTLRRSPMTPVRHRSRRCRLHGRRSWSALPLRAKNLRVDLVGGHFQQRLVELDGVASCLSQRVTVPSVTLSPSAGSEQRRHRCRLLESIGRWHASASGLPQRVYRSCILITATILSLRAVGHTQASGGNWVQRGGSGETANRSNDVSRVSTERRRRTRHVAKMSINWTPNPNKKMRPFRKP